MYKALRLIPSDLGFLPDINCLSEYVSPHWTGWKRIHDLRARRKDAAGAFSSRQWVGDEDGEVDYLAGNPQ